MTQEKDGIIAQLERSLQDKERQLQAGSHTLCIHKDTDAHVHTFHGAGVDLFCCCLQDYCDMLESTKSSKPRDVLLEKLRERIKERDRALEVKQPHKPL